MVLFASAGCGRDAPGTSGQGPALVALDSVLLDESREYVGEPWSVAIHPLDGSLLIADAFGRRVLRFDRSGALLRNYGRPGSGPGEFVGITEVFSVGDSVLAAADHQRELVHRFHLNGEHLGTVSNRGLIGGTFVADGIAWLATVDLSRTFSIGRWDLETERIDYFGPVPREYREDEGYWGHCTFNFLAPLDDALLVGFCGRNELYVTTMDGTVRDTIHLPVRRRRGVPDDITERFAREPSIERRVRMLSLLQNLHRLPDGNVAAVHFDSRLDGVPPGGRLTSQGFLSLLSADRARACVDRPLQASPEIQPRTAFRADTLFLFDRKLDNDRMETWIKWYRISDRGCDWIEMRR